MSAVDAAAASGFELAPPAPRAWLRLGVLLAMGVLWLLPWVEVQALGTGLRTPEAGAARTGAVALAGLIVAWGLGLTVGLARTRGGLRAGEAFTACALAGAVSLLLFLEHPWIPGGDRRAGWLPVFLPLALLAALEGVTRLRAPASGGEVAAVRMGAGLFAAGTLAADERWLLAALAGWVALAPLLFLRVRTAGGARRAIEALGVPAGLVLGFALSLNRRVVTLRIPLDDSSSSSALVLAWCVLAAVVVLLAAAGLLDPEDRPVEAPRPGRAR